MKRSSWPVRYGVAAAAIFIVIALMQIRSIAPGIAPVVFLAIFFSAWYGGIGPGLFATVLFEGIIVAVAIHSGATFTSKTYNDIFIIFFLGAVYTVLLEALHRARRRAEASRQWLSATLSSIGDAVIATDARGRVLLMNPVAGSHCGWEEAEAVGRPLEEVFRIINEQTRQPVESPATRVIAEGTVVGLANHTVLIARDGAERPIDDSGAPIRGPGGEVEGVVLVFRDVTERRRAEARVAEEGRRKDEFLAMLAHELRNPLAAMSNAVQLLAHPGAEDTHDWSLEVIERQVRQLTRLVNDLLDVSRISRGKIQLRSQRVQPDHGDALGRPGGPAADRRAGARPGPDDPVRSDRASGRSGAARAGDRQSAQQRGQVHRARRPDRAGGRPGSGSGGHPRDRHGHRDRSRVAPARLRPVHPGGPR